MFYRLDIYIDFTIELLLELDILQWWGQESNRRAIQALRKRQHAVNRHRLERLQEP